MSFVELAFGKGLRAKRSPSDATILRDGRQHRTLVDTSGRLTTHGAAYEALSGAPLPVGGYDSSQTPTRVGDVETIRLRGGGAAVVRRFDPASGDFKYTRLGRGFYSQFRTEYVLKIPARFDGTRPNGQPYSRDGYWPVSDPVSLPQGLTPAQRDARLRAHVGAEGGVLAEFSEERVTVRAGALLVAEMTTRPTEDGPQVSVTERRLGATPVACSLLFCEHICPEAFVSVDDHLCCARQIAAVTGKDFFVVCDLLDACGAWRERGATAQMIFEYARRQELGACCLHNDRVIESLPGKRPLAFAILGSHAYFYDTPRVCRALAKRQPHDFERMKREVANHTTPAVSEWLPLPDLAAGLPPAGHYYVDEAEIDEVRGRFLKTGRHPKCVLKDAHSTKALRYTFVRGRDSHKGTLHVHTLPAHAAEIQDWLGALGLGLPYRGEGLPGTAYRVLTALIKRNRERVILTGEQKHELLEGAGYTCALCGERGRLEWDHRERFSESFGAQEFQPLCKACHADKTATEPRLEGDLLASHFETTVWDAYVMSPRPPPLCWKAKAGAVEGCRIADVRRCRKRALEHNIHEVPVFSPLDSVQPTDTVLGDIVYCAREALNPVRDLGYTGPGWMHRCQAEFLLHHGIITWADLPYKLTATGRLPADIFRRPLAQMEAAWPDGGLAKQSVNSMIGLWCLDQAFSYKLHSSEHPGDCPPGALKRITQFEHGAVTDIIVKTRLHTTTSMRPLHDLCMCTEAVRVGQMLYCLKRQRAICYELKTDSVLYRPLKRARTDALETLRFRDLRLRERFEPCGQRRLNEYCSLPLADSEDLVFRVADAVERDLLRMNPKRPARDADYVHRQPVMRELDQEEATRRALAGESLLIEGIAGTGKSHFTMALVEQLRALGKTVAVIAKTHTASQRVNGVTADHWVRRNVMHGAANADVIVVDEVYQIESALWGQLNKVSGRQWLLSGDCNQFAALFDSWRGAPVQEGAFRRSNLLLTMCGCNRLTLTQCRRSDGDLFAWYSSLIHGGARYELDLSTVLAEARARFCLQGPAQYNLCVSHRKRIQLNREANERERRGHPAVLVRAAPNARAQDMWVWPGLRLLGCAGHRRIRNGVLYEVEAVGDDFLTVGEGRLTFPQAIASLRLAYAQTYASCQGTEFSGSLALWDTTNRHFSRRHLFVALSRAKRAEDICVK